jgi:hypothetical protein
MSGREVNELVVALRPVGADETTDALEQAQDSFEETADTADQSSEQLEEFAGRFTGALSVATTALTVATGGLLSTVPIIGEAFAGIGAIIQSLGLRIDEFLRELGVSTDFLFRWANAIARAEGPMADFATALLTVVTFLTAIGAPLTFALAKLGLLGGVVSKVTGFITALVGAFSLATAAAGLLALAGAALAAAWITDFKGIRTTTMSVIDTFVSFAISRFDDLVQIAKLIGERMKIIFQGWTNAVHRFVVQGMNGIITAVENAVNSIIRTINRFSDVTGIKLGTVSLQRMAVPEKRATGQRLARNRQAINSVLDRQQGAAQNLAQEIANELGGELPDEIRSVLNIDGKEVANQTSRWRGTSVANRGR